jgi:hypothetical protein
VIPDALAGPDGASAENDDPNCTLVMFGFCAIRARLVVVRSMSRCSAFVTLAATPDACWWND